MCISACVCLRVHSRSTKKELVASSGESSITHGDKFLIHRNSRLAFLCLGQSFKSKFMCARFASLARTKSYTQTHQHWWQPQQLVCSHLRPPDRVLVLCCITPTGPGQPSLQKRDLPPTERHWRGAPPEPAVILCTWRRFSPSSGTCLNFVAQSLSKKLTKLCFYLRLARSVLPAESSAVSGLCSPKISRLKPARAERPQI